MALHKLDHEPASAGMGAQAEGPELKKFTRAIIRNLDEEIDEQPLHQAIVIELNMPERHIDPLKL